MAGFNLHTMDELKSLGVILDSLLSNVCRSVRKACSCNYLMWHVALRHMYTPSIDTTSQTHWNAKSWAHVLTIVTQYLLAHLRRL